jgi:hypothetical protein
MVICLSVKMGLSCLLLLVVAGAWLLLLLWAGSISIMGSGEEGEEPGEGGQLEEEPEN